MATVEVTRARSDALVARLRARTSTDELRTAFIHDALRVIDAAHERGETSVEKFGSSASSGGKSPPIDIARQSLRNVLQQGSVKKDKAATRWESILDWLDAEQSLNGSGPQGFDAGIEVGGTTHTPPGSPGTEAEPEPGRQAIPEPEDESTLPEPVVPSGQSVSALIGRVDAAEENARVTEELLKEAEVERDKAVATVEQLEGRLTEVLLRENEAKEARAEAAKEVRALRKTVKRLETKVGTSDEVSKLKEEKKLLGRRLDDSSAALDAAMTRLVEGDAAMETLRDELDAAEKRSQFVEGSPEAVRGALQVSLVELLGTTEYTENPPLWLLSRLDRLAGLV